MIVSSFYRFTPLDAEHLQALSEELRARLLREGLKGMIVLAPEGINGSVAGEPEAVGRFEAGLANLIDPPPQFKRSPCQTAPFRKASVVCRSEIVTSGRPDLVPKSSDPSRISPQAWHEALMSAEAPIVIDTRNGYEIDIGCFAGAIDPGLKQFGEWEEFVRTATLPRDEPVFLYCTGGIRCEKAVLIMREQGFERVYQLEGGILSYLEAFPEGGCFDGECFVFDERVAVKPDLTPTDQYNRCVGCGDPALLAAVCQVCGRSYARCAACEASSDVCSAACRSRLLSAEKIG